MRQIGNAEQGPAVGATALGERALTWPLNPQERQLSSPTSLCLS